MPETNSTGGTKTVTGFANPLVWRIFTPCLGLRGHKTLFLETELFHSGNQPLGIEDLTARLEPAMAKLRASRSLEVILPREIALYRPSHVPVSARRDVTSIIELDLTQNTPLSLHDVVFSYAIEKTGKTQIIAHAYVVRKVVLNALAEAALRVGLRIRRVSVAGLKRPLSSDGNSLRAERNWMLAAALVLCSATLVEISGYQRTTNLLEQQVVLQQQQNAELWQQAEAQAQAQLEATAQEDGEKEAAEWILQNSNRLKLLKDLTEALPDTVSLSGLRMDRERITLTGTLSDDGFDLVSLLNDQPWVQGSRLSAPLIRDQSTGHMRFQAQISLKVSGAHD